MASTVIHRKFGIRKVELETLIADMDTIESFKAASTGGRPSQMYRYVGTPVTDDDDTAKDDMTWEAFCEDIPAEVVTDDRSPLGYETCRSHHVVLSE
ncbi:hypothetical protein ACFYUV_51165 [Nonomuraea sp. NPDC003560]|uniref:hypothetical protein n=1 Tax=Nonomuraea sp. NPDC003560 TaxID=3364341 RepID=UPI0036C87741